MTNATFWKIVLSFSERKLYARLIELPDKEFLSFEYLFRLKLRECCTSDIADVGLLLCGGMSDDGLDDFGSWLISQGRQVFEKAIENADSLHVYFDGVTDYRDLGFEMKAILNRQILSRDFSEQSIRPLDYTLKGHLSTSAEEFERKFPATYQKFVASGRSL